MKATFVSLSLSLSHSRSLNLSLSHSRSLNLSLSHSRSLNLSLSLSLPLPLNNTYYLSQFFFALFFVHFRIASNCCSNVGGDSTAAAATAIAKQASSQPATPKGCAYQRLRVTTAPCSTCFSLSLSLSVRLGSTMWATFSSCSCSVFILVLYHTLYFFFFSCIFFILIYFFYPFGRLL